MRFLTWLFRFLPDEFVEEVNAVSLDELDDRGLIIWRDEEHEAAIREANAAQAACDKTEAD